MEKRPSSLVGLCNDDEVVCNKIKMLHNKDVMLHVRAMNVTLVLLAAGPGSRFDGRKQPGAARSGVTPRALQLEVMRS
jgi:hypothetical protein